MDRGDLILAIGLPGLSLGAGGLAVGRAITRRRLDARLRLADARGRAGVRQAASAERRRIAADIQALVRRDVDAIAAHVAASRRAVVEGDLGTVAGELAQVSATAAATLESLRRLLDAVDPPAEGVVRGAPASPPAFGDLRDLASGVTVTERGEARLTPPGARLAAVRLARDLLTPAVPARARLAHHPAGLELRLSGRGRRPRALTDPAALVALRERARLHGGSLTAASGLRGWRVRAWLPSGAASATRRLPWSPEAIDAALALSVTAIVVLDVIVLPVRRPALSAAMGIATCAVPVVWRRREPLAASAVAGAGLVGGGALDALPRGPAVPYFVVTIVPFVAGVHAPTAGRALAGVGLTTAGAVLSVVPQMDRGGWPRRRDLVAMSAYGVLTGALTWFARHHHVRAVALAIDESELTRLHPALVHAAIDGERRRVARDLHDVVSHGVTLCGVLAGGVEASLRSRPSQPLEGDPLLALESAVAQTRVELARLVRALELPAAESGTGGDLDRLPALVRGAGPHARLELSVADGARVPADVAACVYRVVQEALTNAHRHAGSPPTRVGVHIAGDAARVEVLSDPPLRSSPGPGTGRGLAGMRERVAGLGGRAEAGPSAEGGFRVEAWLPLATPTG